MKKIHFSLLFLGIFSLFISNATELKSTKELNTTTIKLVKVNNHTITTNILGPKKVHALLHKFTNSERKSILNQLINDEIAMQYAFKYLKIEDNISDEKKRLSFGLKKINDIALKESIKTISDKNASDFYKANKKLFWHDKHYEASHILLNDKNLTIELIDKLNKASDVNSTFKTLAKKYSTDRSSKKGGYIGHFESKIMVKEFRDALEKLKVGEYTHKPIKTPFGYHIILLHSINPKGYFPFDEVKDGIKTNLAKGLKNDWFKKTLLPLKAKADIMYLFDFNQTTH